MKKMKRTLLYMPLILLVGWVALFVALKGGTGKVVKTDSVPGLNPNLPKPRFDDQKTIVNKMTIYDQAERDSIRKREQLGATVYHFTDSVGRDTAVVASPRADALLQQLNHLQQTIHEPPMTMPVRGGSRSSWYEHETSPRPVDSQEADPQMDRLNTMLDKVLRIQHPAEAKPAVEKVAAEEVIPADSSGNAIPAVVIETQTLSSGMRIGLRLTEAVIVDGVSIPAGQLIYGAVSLGNERMQVNVGAIRFGRHLFKTDLQVFDLDGIEGVHIPGLLNRDVAKESADEGAASLNLNNYDASLGAQAANAGIQTAHHLFSRKVRLVRASVRAGYQVLLRNSKYHGPVDHGVVNSMLVRSPPGIVPGGAFLARSRSESLELQLKGIYLKDSVLWFVLKTINRGPISWRPSYVRWFIRDRKRFRRTAVQEWSLDPVWEDSVWSGFRPFSINYDKELVIEMGEAGGSRTLKLTIGEKCFGHIKNLNR